ncbi:MAG: hypothetical protein LH475_06500 [Cryobacterium sp.]|uniref:hypothetical protein n=1 Tax=unclassified Cryobacterium TaxID=2649013 RepID=UPI0018C8E664|nr:MULTISPECIES: hypothetical protein [unclassified Cryobacterium]MCY7404259.1 hypothetical protein [Cryobacterium sp.]MEC5155082.1 hypothetical protein [Cryobacterium sp. CAN_C3]
MIRRRCRPDRAHQCRVERSLFLSQLLVGSSTLLLVAVSGLLDIQLFTNQLFLAGILIVFVSTGVAVGCRGGTSTRTGSWFYRADSAQGSSIHGTASD